MRRKVGPNSFCLQLVVTKQRSFAKPFSKKGGDCVRADTRARARRGSVCVRARRGSVCARASEREAAAEEPDQQQEEPSPANS